MKPKFKVGDILLYNRPGDALRIIIVGIDDAHYHICLEKNYSEYLLSVLRNEFSYYCYDYRHRYIEEDCVAVGNINDTQI
jgi:hypothetical protein